MAGKKEERMIANEKHANIERSEKYNISSHKEMCIALHCSYSLFSHSHFALHSIMSLSLTLTLQVFHNCELLSSVFSELLFCCSFVRLLVHGYGFFVLLQFFQFCYFVSYCSFVVTIVCLVVVLPLLYCPTRDASCALHEAHTLYYECKWFCSLRNMVQRSSSSSRYSIVAIFLNTA